MWAGEEICCYGGAGLRLLGGYSGRAQGSGVWGLGSGVWGVSSKMIYKVVHDFTLIQAVRQAHWAHHCTHKQQPHLDFTAECAPAGCTF